MGALFNGDLIVTTTSFLFVNYFAFVLSAMLPMGFEPSIPASKRLQTHILDHTATGF
jgi:hypothetical protein